MNFLHALSSLVGAGLLGATFSATAAPRPASTGPTASLTVNVDKPGHQVSPSLWGIFFEEINHAGDGGLYAELVSNGSFEESDTIEPWSVVKTGDAVGTATVVSRPEATTFNKHALQIKVDSLSSGSFGIINEGYWGMDVRAGASYSLSLAAKAQADFTGTITARLEAPDGAVLATGQIQPAGGGWARYGTTLAASAASPKARLVLSVNSTGTVLLDNVSLFPKDTFKQRANGMRPDLAGKLADLKPSFMRFPGGCWVEGDTMATSQRWKQTIGDVADRRTQYNLWQYQSGNGLGFHEYLQLCEDLGASALFVINVGMSHHGVVPMEQMGEYVQDALDAIEYANGPATSTWGARRAAAGHPAPFNLKYMEIGNENGGPSYNERYALFYDAITAKYPQVRLIADLWGGLPTSRPVQIVDEHYYSAPGFFIANANKYDTYDRKGPKIYVGEYAVTEGNGQGSLAGALGEAAFMTGMERNSDIVEMASYAPLFANVNYKKWNPDLINFDSSRAYGTPSYYVQKLFQDYKGDAVLPLTLENGAQSTGAPRTGAVGVGTWRTQAEFKDIRVSRNGKSLFAWDAGKGTDGWKPARGEWSIQDGAYRQMDLGTERRSVIGDPNWSDYTLTLKARKISGNEGFLILVRAKDAANWIQVNLGGWDNREHAIQVNVDGAQIEAGKRVPGTIETGRWYDIRVEVTGSNVRCFVDNKPAISAALPRMNSLFAVAGIKGDRKDIVLKVVNTSGSASVTRVDLKGISHVGPSAEAVTLTGKPADENTLENPTNVAPTRRSISLKSPSFVYTFPAHSVTVLKIGSRA
ncbi:MAG TPA: alpha-L-arabinofuranosidase C-terminal domain-containing protein [Armatimonadota bacterium]